MLILSNFVLSLDLDAWINEPEPESDALTASEGTLEIFYKSSMPTPEVRDGYQYDTAPSPDVSDELLQQRRESRKMEQDSNPHYLKSSTRARHSPISSPSDENLLGNREALIPNTSQTSKSTTAKKLSDKYFELEMNKERTTNSSKKHRSKKEKKKKSSKEKRNGNKIF